MGDTEKDLMTLQYHDVISWPRLDIDMNNSKDREKIAKEIAKTSNLIRKKYCALKSLVKWRRISHWRYTSNLLSTRWNRLLKTLLNSPRILLWLKYSCREKTRNQNPKENDWVLCTTILCKLLGLKWNQYWVNRKPYHPLWTKYLIIPRDLSYDYAPTKKFSMLSMNRS